MEICSTATWFAEYFRGYVALAPHTGNGKRARVLQHHAGGTVDRTVLREALPGDDAAWAGRWRCAHCSIRSAT